MYCSREYQTSTRLIQQYEKSTLKTVQYILPISGQVRINKAVLKEKKIIPEKMEPLSKNTEYKHGYAC